MHSGKYTDHKRVIKLYSMLMLLMHFLGMRKYKFTLVKAFEVKHCMKGLQNYMIECK